MMEPSPFEKLPILETERLILREIDFADWSDVLAIYGDEETGRFNLWKQLDSKEAAIKKIQIFKEAREKRERLRWGIVEKQSGKLIGDCAFVLFDRRVNRGEIGFNLNRSFWKQGFMTEALRSMISFGFDTLKQHRIEALVHHQNAGSKRVLAKLGFTHEGTLRELGLKNGVYHDSFLYALLEREWQ